MLPSAYPKRKANLTWVEDVAHRAVIKNHDFAEVRLDLGQILDVRPIAERAMLTIVPCSEVLALDL